MGRYISMVVVFLLVLVLMTSPAKALDCRSVVSNIIPCSNFLKNPKNALPEGSCCNAARKLIDLGDVDSLCKCLQPIASQFLHSKARQIFDFCNLETDSFSPLVKCLSQDGLLPSLPFSSLPSLPPSDPPPPVPFVPLPLIPYGPLPPPISFYPPPDQNFPDGLLPPLPLPLPPLPPLIPLPPLPLPPLPFVPPVDKRN